MSKNPYIKSPDVQLPQKNYQIVFEGLEQTLEIDIHNLPSAGTGLTGSILDIALAKGLEIDHACGGVLACATCHIKVKSGLASCNEASDEELDMLDTAPGQSLQSRLACQCVPNGSERIVVEIPKWNRNLAREEH